jgi:integrase
MHGLRHAYASMLASSGQVDLYTLQRLLTHKSAGMTARYAHLRDEVLQRGANVAGQIMEDAQTVQGQKVVNMEDFRKD